MLGERPGNYKKPHEGEKRKEALSEGIVGVIEQMG